MKFLFISGFLQVFFVAINTWFISKQYWLGVAVCSFLISFIWTFNVSRKDGKVSFTNMQTRIAYSFGATCGAITGMMLGYFLIK
jgi:uncharacterized protein YebE (UPF0316 family)